MRLILILIVLFISTSGCTTLKSTDDPRSQVTSDPFEGFNRSVDSFNAAADRAILRPVAVAYDKTLPSPAKRGFSNFFSNLSEPLNFVNNLLQGKVNDALKTVYRFSVNSTIGIFGLIDVADHYGVEQQSEDFGQTLAAWGVKPGPYVVIPLLGPSNLRDSLSLFTVSASYNSSELVTDNTNGRIALNLLDVIGERSQFLDIDGAIAEQVDPYLFLKTFFETNRIDQIYDGEPPAVVDDIDDF